MNKQQEKSNREKIVDSAWELFWRVGYHATSISHIAKEAGVPKGSVYNYFESKEALLMHVLTRIRYQTETHLRLKILEGTLSPGDIVARLLNHYEDRFEPLEYSRGDPLTGRLMELCGTNPELVDELMKIQTLWRGVVAQKIWAYATVARIPSLVDAADNLAGMIYSALQGVLMQMMIKKSPQPIKEARKVLIPMVNYFVSALATGEVTP